VENVHLSRNGAAGSQFQHTAESPRAPVKLLFISYSPACIFINCAYVRAKHGRRLIVIDNPVCVCGEWRASFSTTPTIKRYGASPRKRKENLTRYFRRDRRKRRPLVIWTERFVTRHKPSGGNCRATTRVHPIYTVGRKPYLGN